MATTKVKKVKGSKIPKVRKAGIGKNNLKRFNKKKSQFLTIHGPIVKKTKHKPTISQAEINFQEFLQNELGIQVETQLQLRYKYYDFVIKGTKLILEFDGDYWHYNPATMGSKQPSAMQRRSIKNDLIKNELASKHGYKLLRIWESDFNNDKLGVKKKIKAYLKENHI